MFLSDFYLDPQDTSIRLLTGFYLISCNICIRFLSDLYLGLQYTSTQLLSNSYQVLYPTQKKFKRTLSNLTMQYVLAIS